MPQYLISITFGRLRYVLSRCAPAGRLRGPDAAPAAVKRHYHSAASFESSALYWQHVNGKVLVARPEIMSHPDATDLTAILRAAQTGRETV
jgi:hypothetical protein